MTGELQELRNMDLAGLQKRLEELRKEQFNLRFQHASGQLENTARIKQVRRKVARVKTLMNEKRRLGQNG